MNWFKETWWLVKQLFTTTKNKDKVQYKHMDHYPFSGYSAMSWCGYILTKKKESDIKTTTYPASSAYYKIPYEMEAYANEDKSDYEINTNKYKIKNRKKTYRENKKNWFNYIKNL